MGQRYTLFFTAREGREDDLRWALRDRKISPDLRDPDTKQTALHLAAAKGRVGCVRLLIDAGKAWIVYQVIMKTQWQAVLNSDSHKTGELKSSIVESWRLQLVIFVEYVEHSCKGLFSPLSIMLDIKCFSFSRAVWV